MVTLSRFCALLACLLVWVAGREVRAADVVVDNDSGAPGYVETGSWTTSASTGYQGGTYRYTAGVSGAPTSSATWTPDLPLSRLYEVYAAYRQSANRTTSAPVTITHSTGSTLVYLNQNGPNEIVETFLGEFLFEAGTAGSARMDNNGATDMYIADAIIWRVPVDPLPVISAISRDPEVASQSDSVLVTATIIDNAEIAAATLAYRVSPSGLSGALAAYDDGSHGDGAPGDSVYGASIPAQPDGSIVAYHYEATDDLGQPAISPIQYYAVGPLPPYQPDVVVDNDDGPPGYTELGSWTTSASVGYDGGTYRYALASPGVATSTATWTPDLPRSGVYRVYAAYAKGANRPDRAPITIVHASGESHVDLDQTGASIAHDLLGEFPFEAGTGAFVRMENNGSEGAYIADAMIWHLPSDLPPVISRVTRDPAVPSASESVRVTARIVDNGSVSAATVSYTVNGGPLTVIPAYDDGAHGDGDPGDGIYGATLPAQPGDSTVVFACHAVDNLGQTATSPAQRYVVGREGRDVYIVLSSDTSVWGVSGYPGVADWEVFESRTGVLSRVYDDRFRHTHVDSLGRPFKLTWFMHGGAWFRTAVNSTPISGTYHIKKNWGGDIVTWGDALEYHFHHYVWSGTQWQMAPTFAETIWEYEWVMSEMMLEEDLFITSFRSGWNYMDDSYQQYLERWVPFRMEGVQSGWVPYHPSFDNYREPGTMKGWEVRHHYTKSFTSSLAHQVFSAADLGADQVVCIWSHQNEADFPEQIDAVDRALHEAHAAHPSVQFHYCSADEAMQRWLGETTLSPPPLEVQSVIDNSTVEVRILTADDIYQEQPWVAARRYAGDCVRLDTVKTAAGVWEFSYSRQEYDRVTVGVSDIYGNEMLADVDDGSRRWAVQSDFARGLSHGVNYDATPTRVVLQNTAGSYVPSGTLAVDHSIPDGGMWQSITLEGSTPGGTNLRTRYKTADSQALLDEAPWSAYETGPTLVLPTGLQQPWMRIEVLLEGTSTSSPQLRALEVHYQLPPLSGIRGLWRLY